MQFTQLATILAIAAAAAASPAVVSRQVTGTGEGWGSACYKDNKVTKGPSADQCAASGGIAYKCTTSGNLEVLNCSPITGDGNQLTIPISFGDLNGDTIPVSPGA